MKKLAMLLLLLSSSALAVGTVTRIVDVTLQVQPAQGVRDANPGDGGREDVILVDAATVKVAVSGSTAGKWTCCSNALDPSPVVIGGYDITADAGLTICSTGCMATGACYPASPNAVYLRMKARKDGGAKVFCQEGR